MSQNPMLSNLRADDLIETLDVRRRSSFGDIDDDVARIKDRPKRINHAAIIANQATFETSSIIPDVKGPIVRRQSSLGDLYLNSTLKRIGNGINEAASEANRAILASHKTSRAKPYKYRRLRKPDNLRLLVLLPGNGQPELEMFEAPSKKGDKDFEEYVTLSYTWGDAAEQYPIILDGCEYQVGKNLYQWLCVHRLPHSGTGPFWVDAMCINQTDKDEKAVQVKMMNAIYKNCTNCIVWLGQEADDSPLAMRVIRGFDFLVQHAYQEHGHDGKRGGDPECESWNKKWSLVAMDSCWRFRNRLMDSRGWFHKEELKHKKPVLDAKAWPAVFKLIARPWFRRIWTVQEFVLPNDVDVICGHERVGAEAMIMMFKMIEMWRPHDGSPPGFNSAVFDVFAEQCKHRESYHYYGKCEDSLSNAFRHRVRQATNVADKVFGVLGMSDDSGRYNGFPVDYTWSTQHLYHQFAVYHFRRGMLLRLFSWGGNRRRIPGLPSWIPEWQIGEDEEIPKLMPRLHRYKGAGMSLKTGKKARILEGGVTLLLQGVLVGAVERCFRFDKEKRAAKLILGKARDANKPLFITALELAIRNQGLREGFYQPRNQRLLDILWRVVCCDTIEIESKERRASSKSDWLQKDLLRTDEEAFLTYPLYDFGRAIFATDRYLGLGPIDAMPGDVLFVLEGFPSPIMLRPKAGSYAYELLGNCYGEFPPSTMEMRC